MGLRNYNPAVINTILVEKISGIQFLLHLFHDKKLKVILLVS
jgi:hypothetical protein